MQRILVTGGAGFIGSAVIRQLLQSGNEIFVIDNLSFGNRAFIPIEDHHFFHADILDREQMLALTARINPHVIIHLAAIHFIPYCNLHPFLSSDINIRGTIHMLEAASKATALKKFFFASTAAVYPIVDDAISEDHTPAPMDIYGLSKLAGEHLCKKFHLESGLPVIVCRFFNAFGPNETNPHLIPEIEKQIKQGDRTIRLGNLTPKRDFIHTYDMANAVESLINKVEAGYHVFNLGRGIEYAVTDIVASFERALGENIHIEVDPERVRKVERMHLLADVTKLKEYTGWQAQWDIDQGITTLLKS
jgi:UDP-glucose 4-epimerase